MKLKQENKFVKIIKWLVIGILVMILLVNLWILIQAKIKPDKVPSIFGYKPFIVLSGSMESSIYTNDLIFVKEVDTSTLKVSDIIAFRDTNGKVTTHRIVDIKTENGETQFITKGDNNNSYDDGSVTMDRVEGKYVLRIPVVGRYFKFISEPIGMIVSILCVMVLTFAYLFISVVTDKKRVAKEDEVYRKEFEEFKKNQLNVKK